MFKATMSSKKYPCFTNDGGGQGGPGTSHGQHCQPQPLATWHRDAKRRTKNMSPHRDTACKLDQVSTPLMAPINFSEVALVITSTTIKNHDCYILRYMHRLEVYCYHILHAVPQQQGKEEQVMVPQRVECRILHGARTAVQNNEGGRSFERFCKLCAG